MQNSALFLLESIVYIPHQAVHIIKVEAVIKGKTELPAYLNIGADIEVSRINRPLVNFKKEGPVIR